jgi:predicted ATP-dependent endonuclease of OLD family
MITRLKVENFTAFDSLELEFGEGIQVFVGANGTGKTHLLKVMYALIQSHFTDQDDEAFSQTVAKMFRPSYNDATRLLRSDHKNANFTIENNQEKVSDSIYSKKLIEQNDGASNGQQSGYILATIRTALIKTRTNSVYIAVKDILGNAKGFQSLYRLREISFEETYDDILTRAYLPSLKKINPNYKPLLKKIEKFIGGTVEIRGEEFYIVTGEKAVEMSLIAEGWRKFALLWLLMRNGSLEKNSVLFWDEPEANLNPWATPFLAEILLQLSREGVQIFLATHSYVLLKELDLQKDEHIVNYNSLYFENGEVRASFAQDYDNLEPNLIERENLRLYYAELGHLLDEEAVIRLESER